MQRDLVQLQRRRQDSQVGGMQADPTQTAVTALPGMGNSPQALAEHFRGQLRSPIEIRALFPTTAFFHPCLPNRGTAKDLITSERALISWDQVSPLTSLSCLRG